VRNKLLNRLQVRFLHTMGIIGVLYYSNNIIHRVVYCTVIGVNAVILYYSLPIGIPCIVLTRYLRSMIYNYTAKCVRCNKFFPLHLCVNIASEYAEPPVYGPCCKVCYNDIAKKVESISLHTLSNSIH